MRRQRSVSLAGGFAPARAEVLFGNIDVKLVSGCPRPSILKPSPYAFVYLFVD